MPCVVASSEGGKKTQFLSVHELSLVEEVLAQLNAENPDSNEAALVRQRFDCLKVFGEAITLYPSIRETQVLRGYVRDEKQLIASLVGLAPTSHLLRIPARIQTVRSFLVTKFHSFALLGKLLSPESRLYLSVRAVLFSVMFTIMGEDVYFSCLEDPAIPEEIKFRLAGELVSLWDSGAEPAMVQHFPFLEALWTARNESPPSFGTMDGISEIIRISIDLEESWHNFLSNQTGNEETKWALDEFLFGLSYEELLAVRLRLRRFGISAVGYTEIRSYAGSAPAYSAMDTSDPRYLHDFYMERKEAALRRKNMGSPGPRRTIEEIYLKYRMTQ